MGEQGAGGRGLGGRDRTPETACRCHGCSGREGRFRRRECAHFRSFELWGHSCSSLFFDHDDEPSWSFPSYKKSSSFFLEAATRCPARTRPIASRSAVAAPDATSTRAPRWAAITASAVTGPREPSSTPGGTAGHGRSPAPRGGGVGGTRGAATGVGGQQRRDGGEGQVGPVWGGSTMVAAVAQLLLQL